MRMPGVWYRPWIGGREKAGGSDRSCRTRLRRKDVFPAGGHAGEESDISVLGEATGAIPVFRPENNGECRE